MGVALSNQFAIESVSGQNLDGYTTSASFNTNWIRLENVKDYSIHAFATSTVTGTLKLQCSNEKGPNTPGYNGATNPAISNPVDITGASATLASGSPVVFNVQNTGYRWVRAVYTVGSGSGAVSVIFNAKG